MKTLREQVQEIVEKKSSIRSKQIDLIKLGLTKSDIDVILSSIKVGKFDFSKLTFGVEIECYNCNRYELENKCSEKGVDCQSQSYNHRDTKLYYKIVSDSSLTGENSNEVVSPVLQGKKGMSSLEKVCAALNEIGARVNRSCGLHVHIGAENISNEHFVRIIMNYKKLERVIDTFMPESRRGNNNQFCRTLQDVNIEACITKSDAIEALGTRYRKVNAHAFLRHKTIEFRQHSGTVDFEKISNWVKFLAKLVEYSEKKEITECVCIEDIPFLTMSDKIYFTNRRNQLAAL